MFISAGVVPSWGPEPPAGRLSKGGAEDPRADELVRLLPGLPLPLPSRAQEGLKGETLQAHLYKINK